MFHWICPECGREIPPSVRECKACDPSAVVLSVVEPIESAPVTEPQTAAVAEVRPASPIVASEPLLLLAAATDLTPKLIEASPAVTDAHREPVVEALPVLPEPVAVPVAFSPEPVPETLPVV